MTLADFLTVFDFCNGHVEIFTLANDGEYYGSAYFSREEVESDFCTVLYYVNEIRPVGAFTLQVFVCH